MKLFLVDSKCQIIWTNSKILKGEILQIKQKIRTVWSHMWTTKNTLSLGEDNLCHKNYSGHTFLRYLKKHLSHIWSKFDTFQIVDTTYRSNCRIAFFYWDLFERENRENWFSFVYIFFYFICLCLSIYLSAFEFPCRAAQISPLFCCFLNDCLFTIH